ncbi:MAG TPA: glycoside hydrolase family 19 protein [Candidatus Binatia bacterium]|nr:glycoside hydrolase family 19 protein [Candidatus Binatia bacterium]
MCLSAAVGPQCPNKKDDVIVVQVLLNLQGAGQGLPVDVDGAFGQQTGDAIEAFQRQVVGTASPDRRVDPGGATLQALRAGLPAELSELKLRGIMPAARAASVGRYFPPLSSGMSARDINTPLRQAHFLSQIGHESGALVFTEELASGDAYEGRTDLGNTQPGDGPRFKGRGLIQLTGRANYTRYGQAKGRNFVDGDNPKLLATDAELAVDVACWFWQIHGLNALADGDDIEAVTRRINGGLNGLEDRQRYLDRAKFFMLPA